MYLESGAKCVPLVGGVEVQVEFIMFMGWAAIPVVAYVIGRVAIRRSNQRAAQRPRVDATVRLAELRERAVDGALIRGRMAEAIRLAEGPVGPTAVTTHRG